jgi:hypothetical protein
MHCLPYQACFHKFGADYAIHCLQSQLLIAQEANAATAATMKKALADQEAVIARLEALLAAAAARSKEQEGWKSTADALQEETTRLRSV